MKILLPYINRSGFDIHSDIVSGGIEKFTKQLYTLFPDEIIPLEITKEDRVNRRTKEIFNSAVNSIKPDILFINNIDSYFRIHQMNVFEKIPTILVIHEPLSIEFRMLPLLKDLQSFIDCGGHVYFVSENQMNFYSYAIKRITGNYLSGVKGVIASSYCEGNEAPAKEVKYNATTIGRSDLVKKPFWIHEKLNNTGVVSCVITSEQKVPSENELKYIEQNKHWIYPQITLKNLSWNETMDNLSKSSCYISTCSVESFGITALEALSRGIPILLCSTNNEHSSLSIHNDPFSCRIISKKIKPKELVDIIKEFDSMTFNDRIQLSNIIKEKYSKEKYIRLMRSVFFDRITR